MPESPLIDASALSGREVLLDCRAGTPEVHPGSVRVSLEKDLSAPGDPAVGGRHPLPALSAWCATVGAWGIGPGTRVAVFDSAGGGLYAARAWWMLRAIGHAEVFVVQGELGARTGATPEPLPPYPAAAWLWPTVTAEEVEARRTDPSWRLVDARSAARWRGEVEPIDPVAGSIAGSVNLPYESMVHDGRLLAADAVSARLHAALGDTPDERVIASCGSGVTACHTLLALAVAGRGPGALYVGSWSEWCRRTAPTRNAPSR